MLGRKTYSQDEIDAGRQAIAQQLKAYDRLVKTRRDGGAKGDVDAAVEGFEAHFFNTLLLTLDRFYVHRLSGPTYEGKDGNPLNEVRVLTDSLMTNGGVMLADNQIKLPPDSSVTGIDVGERIQLSHAQFQRLSGAFFAELETRFL